VTETDDYDGSDGRIKSRATRVDFGSSSYIGTLGLGFDALGLPSSEQYPSYSGCGSAPSADVEYTYKEGHLDRVRRGSVNFASSISYHPNGLFETVVHDNGINDQQDIDPADDMARPFRLYASAGGTSSAVWESGVYRYDPSGNIFAIGNDTYRYDKTSRLTQAIVGGTSRAYDYDAFGNLIQLGGRFWTTSPTTNRVDSFTYDQRGNVESSPAFGSLTYDALNMPTSRTIGSDQAWYAYTANEERIWTGRLASGVETQKLSLRGVDNKVRRELTRGDGGGTAIGWSKDYLYRGSSLLASQSASGDVRHFHLDHLGTTRAITDSAGALVTGHKYWPYGEELTDPEASDNVMQFTGHERDEMGDLGSNRDDLDYMHARCYSPWAGRFLAIDPAGESAKPGLPQSWNRYGYALGNPGRYVDPDGEASVCQP